MSIVEKAVKLRKQPPGKRSVSGTDGVESHAGESDAGLSLPPDTVLTDGISLRGMLSMEDHPTLEQQFRFVKRPLLARIFRASPNESSGNIVMVTSALPGAGKSFVSYNLADSIAREQLVDVVLVDADPIRRNLTVALGQDDRAGLMEALSDAECETARLALPTDVPGLRFLPAGRSRANATELLAGKRLIEILDDIADPDTVVLVDSPPLLLTAEARALAGRVNHTLVVVEAGQSTATDIDEVVKALGEVDTTVSLILNKAPSFEEHRLKGYNYY